MAINEIEANQLDCKFLRAMIETEGEANIEKLTNRTYRIN